MFGRQPRERRRKPSEVLPRAVACLGELGECAIYDPSRQSYYTVPARAGRVLVASGDGRELFVLRPIRQLAGVKPNDLALHAQDLHERFMHRSSSEFYNLVVPAFRKPEFRGQLAILHYLADKDFDDAGDDEDELMSEGPVEWVHYFEKPNSRPAYVDWYSVGHGQFWIPHGEFRVTPAGVEYAPK